MKSIDHYVYYDFTVSFNLLRSILTDLHKLCSFWNLFTQFIRHVFDDMKVFDSMHNVDVDMHNVEEISLVQDGMTKRYA